MKSMAGSLYAKLSVKFLLFVLLGGDVAIIVADEDCTGQDEYTDPLDGLCKKCEKCAPGQQPKDYCGYGSRSEQYSCVPCPSGTFSHGFGYRQCVTCKPCGRWNSVVVRECTEVSDRECGSCYSGFFRLTKSDGTQDEECHPCTGYLKDKRKCDSRAEDIWTNPVYLLFLIIGIVVLLAAGLACIICGKRRCHVVESKSDHPASKKSDICRHSYTDEGVQLIHDLLPSEEQESRTDAAISETMNMQVNPPQNCVLHVKDDSTWGQQPLAGCISDALCSKITDDICLTEDPKSTPYHATMQSLLPYSNRPTIQCTSNIRPPTYSHMSTYVWKPSGVTNSTSLGSERGSLPPVCRRSHSFGNRQPKPVCTSSSESLLRNIDRDSREVGERRAQSITFDTVEFFDTDSLDDENRRKTSLSNLKRV